MIVRTIDIRCTCSTVGVGFQLYRPCATAHPRSPDGQYVRQIPGTMPPASVTPLNQVSHVPLQGINRCASSANGAGQAFAWPVAWCRIASSSARQPRPGPVEPPRCVFLRHHLPARTAIRRGWRCGVRCDHLNTRNRSTMKYSRRYRQRLYPQYPPPPKSRRRTTIIRIVSIVSSETCNGELAR
jgi:hypothetical protein